MPLGRMVLLWSIVLGGTLVDKETKYACDVVPPGSRQSSDIIKDVKFINK